MSKGGKPEEGNGADGDYCTELGHPIVETELSLPLLRHLKQEQEQVHMVKQDQEREQMQK